MRIAPPRSVRDRTVDFRADGFSDDEAIVMEDTTRRVSNAANSMPAEPSTSLSLAPRKWKVSRVNFKTSGQASLDDLSIPTTCKTLVELYESIHLKYGAAIKGITVTNSLDVNAGSTFKWSEKVTGETIPRYLAFHSNREEMKSFTFDGLMKDCVEVRIHIYGREINSSAIHSAAMTALAATSAVTGRTPSHSSIPPTDRAGATSNWVLKDVAAAAMDRHGARFPGAQHIAWMIFAQHLEKLEVSERSAQFDIGPNDEFLASNHRSFYPPNHVSTELHSFRTDMSVGEGMAERMVERLATSVERQTESIIRGQANYHNLSDTLEQMSFALSLDITELGRTEALLITARSERMLMGQIATTSRLQVSQSSNTSSAFQSRVTDNVADTEHMPRPSVTEGAPIPSAAIASDVSALVALLLTPVVSSSST
jgi:hypothetical protein